MNVEQKIKNPHEELNFKNDMSISPLSGMPQSDLTDNVASCFEYFD